jgi:hypothetical protein
MGLCRLGKNVSILLPDNVAEEFLVIGKFVGEKSKPYLCRLEKRFI